MSHDPGRERHMTYRCEQCGGVGLLHWLKRYDEYWCEPCMRSLLPQKETDDATSE